MSPIIRSFLVWTLKYMFKGHFFFVKPKLTLTTTVNQETSEKSAEISKSWLQVWIPPTKIFKTAKIT